MKMSAVNYAKPASNFLLEIQNQDGNVSTWISSLINGSLQ